MQSMTGYASRAATTDLDGVVLDWEWELRALNGRGLDIRMRLPEGIGFMEKSLRDKLAARIARGNVSLTLRLRVGQGDAAVGVDERALESVLAALERIQTRAQAAGVSLQAPTAMDLLGWRDIQSRGPDLAALPAERLNAALNADLERLLEDFSVMRRQEGQALRSILGGQLDEIARLAQDARHLLQRREADLRAHFHKSLEQVMDANRADPARLEQELALLAVKADLVEEIDRLQAHCAAGQALLRADAPVGRKLDFLTQEFNREANTLCSKAQHLEMSRIGLDLKAVIDQMREQVQNVE